MNIACRIAEVARTFPDKKSVVLSERRKNGLYKYPYYTFSEFELRSNQMAHEFINLGITKGMRTLLFVKPCLDFSVITFALFKIGAVPVLIDPGMGLKNLLSSIKQVEPEAMISIGAVHWLRRLKPQHFKTIKVKISLQRVGGRTHFLYEDLHNRSPVFKPVEVSSEDLSAILFTSGGTGIPKGVEYTHGILNAQTDLLKGMFSLSHKETDLPGFPLFALFTLAMGMTSVIPDMDPTKPASCDPGKIVRNILENQTTFVAGSPSIWERVGNYCVKNNIQLPSVKYVVMFGAPVRAEIHQLFRRVLPFGDTYTPYGATECLPVSLISGSEILDQRVEKMNSGGGTCIGRAVANTEIKIIKTTDITESHINEMLQGQIGEILVQGAQVTKSYFNMREETEKAKIFQDGVLWHRMGDLGYLDEDGSLWFLGRKTHRVETDEKTHYSIQVESIFNVHPAIRRTALVKHVKDKSVSVALVIERHDGQYIMTPEFHHELELLAKGSPYTSMIKDFFLHRSFPVDVRHNIKIDRPRLAAWAQNKVD